MAVKDNCSAQIVKVYQDAYSEIAKTKKRLGVFGIDDLAEGEARQFKLEKIKERLLSYDRGWEGNSRTCPNCGAKQLYKGDAPRKLKFDCGEIEIKRAYYVCPKCKCPTFPMDEKLNLAPEMEQGRIREKLSLLATLVAYNQIPEVSRIMLGSEIHAASARRALLKEAELVDEKCPKKELKPDKESTLYLEIDGFMCPTREERKTPKDQGYREAKACQAFLSNDCVEQSSERITILDQLLEAKICSAKSFNNIFEDMYERSNAQEAKQVVCLADGARWIWNLCDATAPEAIQILDFYHAKQHLFNAAKIIYGELGSEVVPWVKEKEGWLLEDRTDDIISWLKLFQKEHPELKTEIAYFSRNKSRMLYKTFKDKGLSIGSGAIESTGKRLAQGRVKGAGMRWNVSDLNPVLMLRAALFDGRLNGYWEQQRKEEDECLGLLAA